MRKITFFNKAVSVLCLFFLFTSGEIFIQTLKEKQSIAKDYNVQKMMQLSEKYSVEFNKKKQEAISKAKEEGWIIRKELDNGQLIELQRLTKTGKPLYFITNNIDAANTISTDEVWAGGAAGLDLSGDGMVVGEWDGGGVLTSHQEFTDQGASRITQKDSPGSTHYHATHVGGTMIAGGVESNAKGMAHEGSLDAYDWDADDSEMIDAGLNGLLVSNHSYGYIAGWSNGTWYGDESISSEEDYRFGFYGEYSARWDSIAYELPYYLIAKAAGNDKGDGEGQTGHPPDGGTDGYDCIGYRGNAKNILTVGAVDDLPSGYTGNPSDVSIASFSSRGPADDGRIKPDLCGNGIGLYSTYDDNNTAYNSISGTSMATPNVAGSLILLQEHWNETQGEYMKSATLKGVAIHTTNEAGDHDGPDYKFGWGLMNTKKAAEVISNRNISSIIEEETLSDGDTYNLNIDASGTEPLVVTICWTDPPGTPTEPQLDPSTPMLVNDLDLQVTDGSTTYYPYKLDPQNPANAATTGDNNVDNVEKIVVDPASETEYTITINHEGTLTDGPQDFSLIVSGINTGRPAIKTDSVYNIAQTAADVDAEVTDEGSSSVTARGIVYSESSAPTLDDSVTYSGSGIGTYTASLSELDPASTYYVRAFATNSEGTNYGNTIEFTTDDYLPDVEPAAITDITTNSADVEAEVTDNGGYSVTDRGFVYSTTTEPTLSDNVVQSGSGIGVFSSSLTSLTPGTKYYVRAYATNSQGTSYSEEHFFTTVCGVLSELPYQQEFSDGMLPACWENTDNEGSGGVWLFDNPGDVSFNSTTASNGFAILDSDYYGSGSNQNADLITPTFDFSAYDTVTLYFEHFYEDYSSETATFSYSVDGGTTWTEIQMWSGSTSDNPAIFEQKLTDEVSGEANVKFKWNYTGSWGWHWAVDDIEITGIINTPTASVEALPGCGSGSGSIIVSSNLSGTQTFYLCDENGAELNSWTGDASSHEFTGLSSDNYTGKVEKNGNVSELTNFVTLDNSTENPTEPTAVSATYTAICEGETTRLSYEGGSGDTFEWYTESCGGTPVGTGNDLTVTPGLTTTYYGRWENACGVSVCDSIEIVVNPSPTAPTSVNATSEIVLEGESTELTFEGGSGDSFEWYTESCGETYVGTGNNLSVTPDSTTKYFGRWENSCGESTCQSVIISVEQPITDPVSVEATEDTICESATARLSYEGGSGETFSWYEGSCGGTFVGSGNNLTVSPASTTTYYGRWENSFGASVCKSLTIVVESEVVSPEAINASFEAICKGTTTRLTYEGGYGRTFEWYEGSCGSNPVGTGNDLTVAPSTNTVYYGRWENSCGFSDCDSIAIVVQDSTLITQQPQGIEATEGESVSLSVVAEGVELNYKWRKDGSELTDGNGYSGTSSPDMTINSVVSDDNGLYDVIVSGDCGEEVSETAEVNIVTTDISELSEQEIKIFPNPTSGKVMILGNNLNGTEITVLNFLGEKLSQKVLSADKEEVDFSLYPDGVYFIRIEKGKEQYTKKVIVE